MRSEYNDAIQRLEISERPPGTMVSRRDKFPVPRKDTPSNWNYIFRNTGNMNIPKYTIPQILILNNHNIYYNSTQKTTIESNLQKARNEIASNKTKIQTAEQTLQTARTGFDNALLNGDDTAQETYRQQIVLQEELINDYQNEVIRLQKKIEEYQKQLKELEYDGKTTFDFPLDQQFTMAHGNRKSIAIRAINLTAIEYTISSTTMSDDICFLSSTINPWSSNNIIGRTIETFHNMPRMFPWDGQQYITVWILNSNGRIIEQPCVRGTIELELIIDNENTYAYE